MSLSSSLGSPLGCRFKGRPRWPTYYEMFIDHVSTKQDRLRSILWKWTPACRGEEIDRAVRKAALDVLRLYPDRATEIASTEEAANHVQKWWQCLG
jgi:hypothetical protein